jgi:predicted AAA+ superfamily ATPase
MIQRLIKSSVVESLFKGKVVIVYGPRQSGKTTLTQSILADFHTSKRVKYYSCDDKNVRDALAAEDFDTLKRNLGEYDLIVLDEAQRIVNIGLKLKLLVDNNPGMQIIATGSASFDLSNKIVEPLTGRYFEFILLPLSILEIRGMRAGELEIGEELHRSLIYGNYPDIYMRSHDESITLLNNLSSSYLYKDILSFEKIKKSETLEKIVTMLALQIGNEVNLSEIAQVVGLNVRTVDNYINLLEKAYILFKVRAYNTNKRTEIRRNFKVYFYDLGIRNSIINNFNALENRNDLGGLFENWCILERTKSLWNLGRQKPNQYFWRSYTQKEVDYIEEIHGVISAFEFKFDTNRISKYTSILKELSVPKITLITKGNLRNFLQIID